MFSRRREEPWDVVVVPAHCPAANESSIRGRKPKHAYGAKGMWWRWRRRVKVRRNSPVLVEVAGSSSDRLSTPATAANATTKLNRL